MSQCWNCGKLVGDLPHPVPFREECPHCFASLHCCKNCRFYSPGQPNDCRVPGTDFVADREKKNFCEEFSLLGTFTPPSTSKSDVEKRLFGD